MGDTKETATAGTPAAPTPDVGPANLLTPSRNSDFDNARRELLAKWLDADDDEPDEPELEEPSDAAEKEEAASAEAVEVQPDAAPTPPHAEGAAPVEAEATETEEDAPTRSDAQEAAPPPTEPRKEPDKPKQFAAKVGDKDWVPPEGLTLTFKADGQERTYPLEEVVRLAQLGENYGRRSRELSQRERTLEQTYQQWLREAQQQLQQQQLAYLETVRRFFEDEEFREQAIDEYERLRSNPEEIQLRMEAQRSKELERQLKQQREQQLAEWNRRVWQTVDQILEEKRAEYPYADPDRVREKFYRAYQQRGRNAISEVVLTEIIREEHEAVARHVEAARNEALREAQARAAQQTAAAVVQAKNQITDQALQREAVAKKVVSGTAAPVAPKSPGIKTFQDASKALRDWAEK